MKHWIIAAMMLPVMAVADVSATPSAAQASTFTAKAIANAKKLHAFMLGDRLLVTGSSLGLLTEKEARIFAAKDAAQTAAEFLDKEGLQGQSMEIRQGVENAVLVEKSLAAEDVGAVRVEDIRQERWSNEAGVDRYSIHLVVSVRVGKKHKAAKK